MVYLYGIVWIFNLVKAWIIYNMEFFCRGFTEVSIDNIKKELEKRIEIGRWEEFN